VCVPRASRGKALSIFPVESRYLTVEESRFISYLES